jgi:hypothetical protein
VRRETIKKVEISRGRRSRARGAAIGALAGFAVGAIAVLATPEDEGCPEWDHTCWDFAVFSKEEGAALVGGMGAALGALIGLAIPPARSGRRCRWRTSASLPGAGAASRWRCRSLHTD